ncbi:MAG: hypothetical protein ABI418_11610, partial [Jatrophihabitantaceae bacterium]
MASLRPRFGVELDFLLPKLIGRTGASNGSQDVRLFVMTERELDAAGNDYYAVMIEVAPAGVPAHAVQVAGQTLVIDEPLGLSGVRLDSFSLTGKVYSAPNGSGGSRAAMDLVLRAAVTFPLLDGFRLTGALAVQAGLPVLAAVQLQPSQPITLTKLMTGLIGIDMSFAAAITDAIAFVSGSFYWMATPVSGSGPSSLTLAIYDDGQPVTFTPGYHLSGTLDLFGGHQFEIDLGVAAGLVSLTTSTDASFDLYFLTLNQTRISYIDGGGSGNELQVSTVANVFGTDVQATFSAVNDHFEADIGADGCTLSFAWSEQNGMQIVGMDGLLATASDAETMIAKFEDWVHATGDSCADLLTKWFDDIGKITFTPGLDGSPTRSGSGM